MLCAEDGFSAGLGKVAPSPRLAWADQVDGASGPVGKAPRARTKPRSLAALRALGALATDSDKAFVSALPKAFAPGELEAIVSAASFDGGAELLAMLEQLQSFGLISDARNLLELARSAGLFGKRGKGKWKGNGKGKAKDEAKGKFDEADDDD